jgi:hypothetical protein
MDHARRLLGVDQETPRLLQEQPTGIRQADAALGAVKELRPKLLLQAFDLVAQRGLGHVQPLGRPAEVQLLCNGHEVTQALEVHRLLIHVLYQLVNKKYWTYLSGALRMFESKGGRRFHGMADVALATTRTAARW